MPAGDERPPLKEAEHYVTLVYAQGLKRTVVQREAQILDLMDCQKYEKEVQQAMLEELQRWLGLGAFERMPKHLASNVIDAPLGFQVAASGRQVAHPGAIGRPRFRRHSSFTALDFCRGDLPMGPTPDQQRFCPDEVATLQRRRVAGLLARPHV